MVAQNTATEATPSGLAWRGAAALSTGQATSGSAHASAWLAALAISSARVCARGGATVRGAELRCRRMSLLNA